MRPAGSRQAQRRAGGAGRQAAASWRGGSAWGRGWRPADRLPEVVPARGAARLRSAPGKPATHLQRAAPAAGLNNKTTCLPLLSLPPSRRRLLPRPPPPLLVSAAASLLLPPPPLPTVEKWSQRRGAAAAWSSRGSGAWQHQHGTCRTGQPRSGARAAEGHAAGSNIGGSRSQTGSSGAADRAAGAVGEVNAAAAAWAAAWVAGPSQALRPSQICVTAAPRRLGSCGQGSPGSRRGLRCQQQA